MVAMCGSHSGDPQDTKQQILDVARRLFSDRSYLGVSMSDIAGGLQVTKAALYYHFTGKQQIYVNVLEDVFSDLRTCLCDESDEGSPDTRLREMMSRYLEFGMREKNLVNALAARTSPGEEDLRQTLASFRQEISDLFRPVLERLVSAVRPTQEIDGGRLATMLTAMMDGLILEYSVMQKALDPDKISGQIVAFIGMGSGSLASA